MQSSVRRIQFSVRWALAAAAAAGIFSGIIRLQCPPECHNSGEPGELQKNLSARRSSIRDVPSVLAAIYGGAGDCAPSNPDIAPSSCAMDCTEPSIRSTVVESARISSRMLRMSSRILAISARMLFSSAYILGDFNAEVQHLEGEHIAVE